MQILELAAKLQTVGLTDKQAKVYVAALFLGPSAVQKIAQQADVKRATTYVILGELAEMGLVSESTEANKTVYIAEPPEAIGRYLDGLKADADKRKTELQSLIPDLEKTARTKDSIAPVVKFYKNLKGSNEASRYTMRKAKKGDTVYVFYNEDDIVAIYGTKPETGQIRIKKGIHAKVLYYTSSPENEKFIVSSKQKLRVSKKITKPPLAEIELFPGRATFVTYKGKDSSTVLIESYEVVETLRQLFDLAFNNIDN